MPQQPLGFKVVRRPDGSDHLDGAQLMDLPNGQSRPGTAMISPSMFSH